MFRLAAVIYILLSSTLAGVFIIVALTIGMGTLQPILWAALAGFVVALARVVVGGPTDQRLAGRFAVERGRAPRVMLWYAVP